MRIGRSRDRSRHIAVVCRDARQKRIQRSACSVILRVGALITDQAAAVGLGRDGAQTVIDRQAVHRNIVGRVNDIRADRTADIVPSLHTARLDGQLLLEQLCRSIQTDQTADTISGCGNTAADERVIDVNRAVRVVIADQTADIVSADNDTRHTPVGDCVILVAEGDRAAVVASQTARIAADSSPVRDTPVDRIIGVRNIACTVYDGRIVLICTANTADIHIVSRSDTCVDAVFDRRTAFILTDDAADIRIADDIACINGCSGAVFTEQCRLRIRLIQRTDDATDILAAENVAVCLGLAVIQHTLLAVADNAADISAAQLVSILLLIGVAVRISGTAPAFRKRRIMRVADNAADIMSCQRMIICGCAAENQTLILAVSHIFSRGLILAGKIACNAANRAIARYSGAVGQGLDCGTVCCQAARNTADTARSTAGRQRTAHGTRCRQLDYRLRIADLNHTGHTADALRLCRSQRSLHPGLGAVHVIALQRAIAVTADCADTLELVRGNLHLRIEQAQIMDCACVFPEQTKIFCVIGNRGLIQLEITDDIPAGKHAGNAVQQTACAVQCLIAAQRRDTREADILVGGDRKRAAGCRTVNLYTVARPVQRTRGNSKCRRRIHITDIGQMTEGFDLAPTVIRPGAVTEKRVRLIGFDSVTLLILLTAGVFCIRVRKYLHSCVNIQRVFQFAAEARDAGIAALPEGCFVISGQLIQLVVQLCIHHTVQHKCCPLVGTVVFHGEGIILRRIVLGRNRNRLRTRFQIPARNIDRQELRFVLTAVQLDLVINLIQILILHIARPVQRQGFTVYQIDRGDLQLSRIQTDSIDCILNRVIAQPFFPARIAVALAVINIQPAAGHIRRFAVLIRSVVQSLAVCAVENRINLTAFHIDFDADCSIQHTFIVGILRKKRTDERTVTRQLAFCVFACIQTNAVNTADQLFPVLIRLIKRLIQHAFLLHLAAE